MVRKLLGIDMPRCGDCGTMDVDFHSAAADAEGRKRQFYCPDCHRLTAYRSAHDSPEWTVVTVPPVGEWE